MKKSTMTLPDVQPALDEQDRQLEAAYRTLTNKIGASSIELPVRAIDCLRDACEARVSSRSASKPISGVRC